MTRGSGKPLSVSIAMATFNGARFLPQQLESINQQTVQPLELLVGDDGSTDETLEILSDFAKHASFPVIVERNALRLGYRANFVALSQKCRGDLIAFCDQDDVWHSEKLRIMIEVFDNPDVLLAYHNCRLIDEGGHFLGLAYNNPSQSYAPLTVDPWVPIFGHRQIMRRELNKWAPLQSQTIDPLEMSEPMAHDQFFGFWASILGTIAYQDHLLADYRLHDDNLYGLPVWTGFSRFWHEIQHMHRYIPSEAAAVQQRIGMLKTLSEQLSAVEQQRMIEALRYHEALLPLIALRARLYDGSSYWQRVHAFLKIVRGGGYTHSNSWRFGIGGLAMDFCLGLLFGPYLRHLNRINKHTEADRTTKPI